MEIKQLLSRMLNIVINDGLRIYSLKRAVNNHYNPVIEGINTSTVYYIHTSSSFPNKNANSLLLNI